MSQLNCKLRLQRYEFTGFAYGSLDLDGAMRLLFRFGG